MARLATHWHKTTLDGKSIWWISGDEGTGLRVCSVHDPEHDEPARRVSSTDGSLVELLEDEPRGLTVYGSHKWGRPSFDDFARLAPGYAYLVEGILEGRGVTDGEPSSAARTLGALGGAAGKGKPKPRPVARTAKTRGAKGGAAGAGAAKARTSEQARAAARARWDRPKP